MLYSVTEKAAVGAADGKITPAAPGDEVSDGY